jgi:hypothetical protein
MIYMPIREQPWASKKEAICHIRTKTVDGKCDAFNIACSQSEGCVDRCRGANFDNLGSNRDESRCQRHANKINALATARGKTFLMMAIPPSVLGRSRYLVIRYQSLVLGRIVVGHSHDVS